MRITRITTTAVTAALLVAGLAACGSSAAKAPSSSAATGAAGAGSVGLPGGAPKTELTLAAAVMQKAGSAKIALSSTDGSTGSGVYGWSGKPRLDFAEQSSGKPLKVRLVDDTVYLGASDTEAVLLGGKHWVKLPASGPGGQVAASFKTLELMVNPAAQLAAAAQAGTLKKVGAETLDGVQAQHYQSTMPVATLLQSMPDLTADQRTAAQDSLKSDGDSITTDFWLNDKRQLLQEKEVGSDSSATPETVKYTDLGTAVNVTAPPASDLGSAADAAKLLGGS
ncbi:hypothetical protein C7C46_16875 [Streptomyces tateyamensis]|uniref:Lipoprotein n=1 Tax=Streptomyces tateyamensis TaxID=565073 RepID=A0A2V4N8Z4_9ACTN|nr:hypothetical protein [Streptomyces tateyamensis]PYC78013.1 hypothetical protein C7C46_16875 [Streptomyces tateyamensis]